MDLTTRCTLIIDASDEDGPNVTRASKTMGGPDCVALAIAGAIEGAGWCRQVETVASVAAYLEEWSQRDPVDLAREVFGAEIASAMFRFLRAAREVRDLLEKYDAERGARQSGESDDDEEEPAEA